MAREPEMPLGGFNRPGREAYRYELGEDTQVTSVQIEIGQGSPWSG